MKKSMITLSTAALLSTTFVSPALASSYTVKQGDTLTKIAREHDTTVQNLLKWNNLKSDFLQINQKLIVSSTSTASKASVTLKKENTSTYTIVAGDTLIRIANKHNITLAELKDLNNLTSDRIYAGDTLIVSKETVKTVVDLPKANTSTTKTSTTTTGTYTVVKGDSLSKIALQYKTTVAELKKTNSLKSDFLQIGQKLKVPGKNSNTTSSAEKTSTSSNSTSTSTYTVVRGDTLSGIAAQFKTSVSNLKKLNSLKSDFLQIGQKLKVPTSNNSGTNTNQTDKAPASPTSSNIDSLIEEAKKLIGTPYSWAGSTPSGFDCSGFIYYAMKQAGYDITRLSSSTYYDLGKKVSNPRPGDFVYFATGSNPAVISHMGIYLGNNEFIHASSSSGVKIDSVNSSYFKPRLIGYNRVAN